MSNEWVLFALGMLTGWTLAVLLVVAFWASETRRFHRKYKRPDEHATHYVYRK